MTEVRLIIASILLKYLPDIEVPEMEKIGDDLEVLFEQGKNTAVLEYRLNMEMTMHKVVDHVIGKDTREDSRQEVKDLYAA